MRTMNPRVPALIPHRHQRALTAGELDVLKRDLRESREAIHVHCGVREIELSADWREREDQIDMLARGMS